MVLLSQSQVRHCPLAMAAPSYGGHESLVSMPSSTLLVNVAACTACTVLPAERSAGYYCPLPHGAARTVGMLQLQCVCPAVHCPLSANHTSTDVACHWLACVERRAIFSITGFVRS